MVCDDERAILSSEMSFDELSGSLVPSEVSLLRLGKGEQAIIVDISFVHEDGNDGVFNQPWLDLLAIDDGALVDDVHLLG